MNTAKVPLPTSIEGVTGPANIAALWRKHYRELFNCIKSESFSTGKVCMDNVCVTTDEVHDAIMKLSMGKSCGLDRITAEHLKYASYRVVVLLSLCFTAMLMHGAFPSSMLSVLLVPVVKDKTGKISSIDNYRPIALSSVISKVLESILLNRFQRHLNISAEQFGFKSKHGTDMCIYALKEAVTKYRKQNSTMHLCFLDASKAFDRINHGKLLKKLHQRQVPPYLIRAIQFWYTHQTVRVRWGSVLSDPFLVTNGVRQGDRKSVV